MEEDEQNKQQAPREETTRRMYDCAFCKRGFTNAQALGGHMNIHRKDRAKSTRKNAPSSSSSSSPTRNSNVHVSNEYYLHHTKPPSLNMPPSFSTDRHQPPNLFYPVLESQHSQGTHNYGNDTYSGYQAPMAGVSSPSQPHGYNMYENVGSRGNEQDPQGVDLSLGLGSMQVGDDRGVNRGGDNEDDYVDLELRLGHDRP